MSCTKKCSTLFPSLESLSSQPFFCHSAKLPRTRFLSNNCNNIFTTKRYSSVHIEQRLYIQSKKLKVPDVRKILLFPLLKTLLWFLKQLCATEDTRKSDFFFQHSDEAFCLVCHVLPHNYTTVLLKAAALLLQKVSLIFFAHHSVGSL